MQVSKGHSLSGEPRQRDKSGHRKNAGQQGALTSWRAKRERQVRTWKEFELASATHALETTDGETSQDTERLQANNGHSRPGDPRQRDKSGHRKNVSQ